MTFAQLRRQVDTLMCKYATEREIYRAQPLTLELCDEMADAVTPGRPNPMLNVDQWARILFDKLRKRSIRPRSSVWLAIYLEGCLGKLLLPRCNDVLRCLFPSARK